MRVVNNQHNHLNQKNQRSVLILKIPSLPCLYKISPGSGVENIHRRHLAGITCLVGNLIKLYSCRFATIAGNSAHQYTPLGSAGILAGYFNIIIRHFSIYSIFLPAT